MGDDNAVSLEVLIQIREELAGLNRTRQGLQGAKKDAESLGSILKQGLGIGSGMAIATEAVAMLKNSLKASVGAAFELAETVKDQSEALGLTTDAYQVLRYELAQAGVDSARLTMAISTQNQSLAQARAGAGAAADAYRVLGLSISEVEQLSPERRLEVVVRAALNATDKTKGFDAASTILGNRGLPQLLNGLKRVAGGYGAVEQAARDAGAVMSASNVAMLDAMKKRVDNFKSFTLPVATGAAIGFAQSGMDYVGAGIGNIANWVQGRVAGTLDEPAAPPKSGGPAPRILANARDTLPVKIAINDARAQAIQNNSLIEETEKRELLAGILDNTVSLYEQLGEAQFGDKWEQGMTALQRRTDLTDEENNQLKEMWALEVKIRAVKADRLANVDTPLAKVGRELNDTTKFMNETLASGLSSGVNGLANDIIAAANGTQAWSAAWRNMGNVALQMLQQIIARMLIVSAINSVLGLFGFGLGGAAGIVKVGPTVSMGPATVVSGGGGSFLTNGPTNFTVGDNPGGVELVNVTPISGVGQTTVNGHAMKMAGGGSALVNGGRGMGGGDTFNFSYAFNGGVTRQEVMAMIPGIVETSKGAVLEAQRRRRGGF